MLLQQFTALLGRHSGKSFFPEFLLEPSVLKFFPDRALKEAMPFYQLYKRPVRKKFRSKVFGKGFGGEPFLRKVSPDKSMNRRISIKV